jgi:AAA domain
VTFEAICQRFDARQIGSKMMAKCPAHDDKNPSLSIDEGSEGKILLKCWGGCKLEEVLRASQLQIGDLFQNPREPSDNGAQSRVVKTFDWDSCILALSDKAMEGMAKSRGFSMDFVAELKTLRLIGVYHNHFAVPVFDRGNVVGVQYRIKEDHTWRYYPEGIKTLDSRVWVVGLLDPKNPIDVFESNFDGLSFMERSGYRDNILITRGTANARAAARLVPKGATVRLYTQNDGPGEQWQADFCEAARCVVKRVKIPIVFKDFNQWMQDGEPTPDEVIRAISEAEVLVFEAQKQDETTETKEDWFSKIAASIVLATKEDIGSLVLKPRVSLLGEWLCEGDYGIIFGPRGVAKTWFSLMIAHSVATAGTIGEWAAEVAKKVLFIDGEMPADMIRDRLLGLGGTENITLLNHEILFDRTQSVINITSVQQQDALLQLCIQQQFKLLILDNLSVCAFGIKENDSFEWEQLHRWLLQFRRHGIAVILLHHAGKTGQIRGTTKREDAAAWVISLTDAKERNEDKRGSRFISYFAKQSRNCMNTLAYEWHVVLDDGRVDINWKLAQGADLVLQCIREGVSECSMIAGEMGVSPATVCRLAKKLQDSGKIEVRGRKYILTLESECE